MQNNVQCVIFDSLMAQEILYGIRSNISFIILPLQSAELSGKYISNHEWLFPYDPLSFDAFISQTTAYLPKEKMLSFQSFK